MTSAHNRRPGDPTTVVILCGGRGTRLGDELGEIPKPMVEVGGQPILWHIMKMYSYWGYNDFVLCLGFRAPAIRQYFANYVLQTRDVEVDLARDTITNLGTLPESWRVRLIDTGLDTMTAGRLRAVAPFIDGDRFLATYGDGVSTVDIPALVATHRAGGFQATVTAVRPTGRFGNLTLDTGRVSDFDEKPRSGDGWINGGFFVIEKSVLGMVTGPSSVLEQDVLPDLARRGQLGAFQHEGFWQNMDTPREVQVLREMWGQGAPWRLWE